MNKLLALLENADRKYFVELTPAGPVLTAGNIKTLNALEVHEISKEIWEELQAILQTGKLDNAKVKEIIKAKSE